jgi:hypothetical protein
MPADAEVYPVYSLFGSMPSTASSWPDQGPFRHPDIGFLFGIEQSLAIPAGALMMGYRHHQGFEFGVGPVYNPAAWASF